MTVPFAQVAPYVIVVTWISSGVIGVRVADSDSLEHVPVSLQVPGRLSEGGEGPQCGRGGKALPQRSGECAH